MSRKITNIILIVGIALCICYLVFSGKSSGPTTNTENTETFVTVLERCKINDKSTIEEDFELLNMDCNEVTRELVFADLAVMFPVEDVCYVYYKMPVDMSDYEYRIRDIVVDGQKLELELIQILDGYHKYKFTGFEKIKNEENYYKITEVNFYNRAYENDAPTFNITKNVTIALDEEKFFFEQENEYAITLMGENFESIYQFNKENNLFVDLWGKAVGNTELLDEDERSFFYFAFNCYDTEHDIYFKPDDILQLKVEYERLTYEYQGKEKEEAENLSPNRKHVEQIIKPDERKVAGGDEKRSNKKLYIYNTINKLSEADLSKDVSSTNATVLNQAAKQYDWAVQFGAEEGYPYKNTEAGILWKHQYDINYTEIEDLEAIHIVYRHEGRKVSTGTNSLVYKETITVPELVKLSNKAEEFVWNFERIWQSENFSFMEKIVKTVELYTEIIIPFVLVILLIILIRNIRKSRLIKAVGKYIGNKIIKAIEDKEL